MQHTHTNRVRPLVIAVLCVSAALVTRAVCSDSPLARKGTISSDRKGSIAARPAAAQADRAAAADAPSKTRGAAGKKASSSVGESLEPQEELDVPVDDPAAIPADEDPAPQETLSAASEIKKQPAHFNGVQPGSTRRGELERGWGQPKERHKSKSGLELHYAIEPFDSVVVTTKADVVETIVINLVEPIGADRLATELKLSDIIPVTVREDNGEPMGEAYPERGVLFSFAPGAQSREVRQILLAPLDAESFLLRAEANRHSHYERSLADLDYAIHALPENARAHWVRAMLLIDLGRYPKALADAQAAVQLDDRNPDYRGTLSVVLDRIGEPEAAIEEARKAVELAEEGSIEQAAALACQAEALLFIPEQDYRESAQLHQQAIAIADALADDPNAAVSRRALELLLKSHLALARDIAWGSWRSKNTAVPQWLDRAQAIAREIKERQQSHGDEEFQVAREALAAYVGLQGKLDPKTWAEAALRTGREQIRSAHDSLVKSRAEWELGLAMYDTLQIYHMRRMYQPALEFGTLAVNYLEKAGLERARQPGHAYMMGRLYFRIGSIHAIQYKDHAKALPWFEKAVPLLEEPIPDSALADVGRQGETFVSIAVSYWETSRHEEAVQLTKEGLRLVKQAVDEGILDSTALLIPYGNLARMHQQLGDLDEARHYSQLAAGVGGVKQR